MIIEHFDFVMTLADQIIYQGNTHFGFFTEHALAQQVGIHESMPDTQDLPGIKPDGIVKFPIEKFRPLSPEDRYTRQALPTAMPATALCMFDEIDTYDPKAGLMA